MSIGQTMKNTGISTPVVQVKPKEMKIHDHTRVDNYYWLNERENPEVINYLKAENTYLDAVMSPVKPLQEKLFQEFGITYFEDKKESNRSL